MSDEEPVPRIGRGPLFGKMQAATLFKIAGLVVVLIAVVVLRRPCADSVSGFVNSFSAPPDAAPAPLPRDMEVIRLTPEEIERRFPSTLKRSERVVSADQVERGLDANTFANCPTGREYDLLHNVIGVRELGTLPAIWQEVDGFFAAEFWIADGGLSTFIERDSDVDFALSFYERIGARQRLAILREAREIYGAMPASPDAPPLEDPGWGKLEQLSRRWYAISENEQTRTLVDRFVREKPELFAFGPLP